MLEQRIDVAAESVGCRAIEGQEALEAQLEEADVACILDVYKRQTPR